MKKLYVVIYCILLGCTNTMEQLGDCEYINYSNYPIERLTDADLLLLNNVDFREGNLSNRLSLEEAKEYGISDEKYMNFQDYLRYENERIKSWLDSGMIVFYNEKPYALDEKLLEYVELDSLSKSRSSEDSTVFLKSVALQSLYPGQIPTAQAVFEGPSRIGVYMTGSGTVYLNEQNKGISSVIVSSLQLGNRVKFKWGISDRVNWVWSLRYAGIPTNPVSVNFEGYYRKTDTSPIGPPGLDPNDPNNPYNPIYDNNLPDYITTEFNVERDLLYVRIECEGIYSLRVYVEYMNDLRIYDQLEEMEAPNVFMLHCPPNQSFWFVVYVVNEVNGNKLVAPVGDRYFPGKLDGSL